MFFFFKQKTAYEMRISDWSSDVCSSDLFESEQQDDGVEVQPEHDDDQGADGAVDFVIGAEITDEEGEQHRSDNGQESGEKGTGSKELPYTVPGGAVIVQKGDGQQVKSGNNKPAGGLQAELDPPAREDLFAAQPADHDFAGDDTGNAEYQ